MKRFLLHTFALAALVVALGLAVLWQADGWSDPYYVRFTTPPPNSLILGTSRPAQGLQPSVMNEVLPGAELFNFSFTIAHSPYGPTYLEGIKTKLGEDAAGGTFILAVDPWSVSSELGDPEEVERYRERGNFLTLRDMSSDPNLGYLLYHYTRPFWYLLGRSQELMYLHRNGWLEVMVPMDSASVAERTRTKLESYRNNNLPDYKFSNTRMNYLGRTVDYLSGRGEVYLVRLPIHPGMMEIERELTPDFSRRMRRFADSLGVPFLDLTPDNAAFRYTDGNHLSIEDGAEVSRRVARWIRAQD